MRVTKEELIAAVLAAPNDDAPRTVLADWYMAQGDPRGDFILCQIMLGDRSLTPSRRAFLRSRVQELLSKHEEQWAAPARAWASEWQFRRGFIGTLSARARALLGDEVWKWLWQVEPVERLAIDSATPADAETLASSPLLERIRHLTIRGSIGAGGAAALAESPYIGNLMFLNLRGNGIGDEGAVALSASTTLRCTTLGLTDNEITDEGAGALARSPLAAGLEVLYLSRNPLGDEGAVALAQSPHLGKLRRLGLDGMTELSDDGAQALAESTTLVSLSKLELRACDEIGSQTMRALRKRWPRLLG